MKIIQPLQITDENLTAINVPENDYPLWDGTTAYAIDSYVMLNHAVYKAAVANTNRNPETDTTFPAAWSKVGPTNQRRMFDEKVGTVTYNPGSIEFTVSPGEPIDSVAFFGVTASTVQIVVRDGYGAVVEDLKSAPVVIDNVTDWHSYFFNPIVIREDFILGNLPPSKFNSIDVRIAKTGEPAAAGSVVLGRIAVIGDALQGSSVGITDYSRKERDDFGNWMIVERDFSKRAEFDVAIETRQISHIQRMLAKLRAKPIVWIGDENIEATVIYGYYKDFSIVIGGPNVSDCSITVEGLT